MNGFQWGVVIVVVVILAGVAARQDAEDARRRATPHAPLVAAPPAEDARLAAVRAKLPTAATDVRGEGGNWYSFSLKLPDGNTHRYLVAVWQRADADPPAWAITRADGP